MAIETNLINKKFGKITIIADAGYDCRYKEKRKLWLGKCECGKEKKYSQELLIKEEASCGKCKSVPIEKNNYKPTSDRYSSRDSTEYKKFAKQVFKRDKHKCVICGSSKKLNAHHLNAWHWYPQGRFDPNNAVTLCGHYSGCHKLFHKMFGTQQNTKQQFEIFFHHRKLILQDKTKKQKP